MSEAEQLTVREKIREVIAAYKADFGNNNEQERYKREALQWYKEYWDINASDFAKMFKIAFEKSRRLLSAKSYLPYRMTLQFAQKDPETVRNLFCKLYDENIPIEDRYNIFIQAFKDYAKSTQYHTNQDMRSLSIYLAFQYPDKYFLYKHGDFMKFSEHIGYGKCGGGCSKI